MSNNTLVLHNKNTPYTQGADAQMLQMLVDMGFAESKSEKALIAVKNKSVDAAIEYLSTHGDDMDTTPSHLESEAKPGPQPNMDPNSLEAYRALQKERHTAQGGASSKSTNAPSENVLSAKERELLASATKLRGDSEKEKEQFREKVRLEEMERVKKEKREKAQQLKLLRAQIKAEKKAREEKIKQTHASATLPTKQESPEISSTSTTDSSSSTPSICQLQLRLPDGTTIKHELSSKSTLKDVAEYVASNNPSSLQLGHFSLVCPFPRKEYTEDVFMSTTLNDAQLVPRGSLIVQEMKNKGVVKKGDGEFPGSSHHPYPYPTPQPPAIPRSGTDYDDDDQDNNDDSVNDKMLLCRKWDLSTDETPENQSDLHVYRPSKDKTTNLTGYTFYNDGQCLKRSSDGALERGDWKMDQNSQIVIALPSVGSKTYHIVTITDEILILRSE